MSKNTQGVLWAILATAFYTIATAMSKMAVTEFHVLQVLLFRQIAVLLLVLPRTLKTFPANLKTDFPKLHALRLIGAFIGMACTIWALAYLPLTTAVVLAFSRTFFVALLAIFFLGELVGQRRTFALVVGIAGVMIVTRPGFQHVSSLGVLIGLVAAMAAAVAVTCTKKLSQTDSPETLLLYQAGFIGFLAGVSMFWFWQTPDWPSLALLVGFGVMSTIGQWIGIIALRLGDASIITGIDYVALIHAAILGYLLFAEIPDIYVVVGAVLIVISAIAVMRS